MKKLPPLLFLLILWGCNINELDFDNLEAPTYTGRVALPLGNVFYTIRDLLDEVDADLDLEEDSASLLYLTYYDSANFDAINEILQIDDITNEIRIALPETPVASPQDTTILISATIALPYPATNNETLDSIFYSGGSLSLDLIESPGYEMTYSVEIENTIEETNGTKALFNTAAPTLDLTNYKTFLTNDGTQNTFDVIVDLSIILPAGQTIGPDESVAFALIYADQSFDAIYGKFGQDTLQVGAEQLDVGFFEEIGSTGLTFGSPIINFTFRNGFGVSMGLLFNGMYGVNGEGASADTTYLAGSITNSPQGILGAPDLNTLGISTLTISKENSTLRDFLGSNPGTIGFDLSAISNYNDANASNFILDTSAISTAIEIIMPLEISLDNLSRDIDFSLGGGLGFDEADTATIRIVTENELPLSVNLKMDIRDENDSVLYVITNQLAVEPPIIDQNGLVAKPRMSSADFALSKDGITAMNEGDKVFLTLTLNTPGQGGSREVFIKVLADYGIKVQVSAIGKLNYQL